MTDEMVRAAAEGAEPERTRVLEALEPWVRLMVIARLGPPVAQIDGLKEVTQEVMVALTPGITRLENQTARGLRAFTSQIVRHKVSDLLSRQQKGVADGRPIRSLDSTVCRPSGAHPLWQLLSASGTSPGSAAARAEQIARLMAELGQLKPRYREVITLAVFDALPMAEIAREMGLAQPATARQLLKRALLTLRRKMQDEGESKMR
ncbi:MAG: sigma-70 family RNA polymerase sigma factor [Phycisphaerae bacterium]|nr:sigma-70 family RNA polymerase sigma factor [Phycisphaerae bacterium]